MLRWTRCTVGRVVVEGVCFTPLADCFLSPQWGWGNCTWQRRFEVRWVTQNREGAGEWYLIRVIIFSTRVLNACRVHWMNKHLTEDTPSANWTWVWRTTIWVTVTLRERFWTFVPGGSSISRWTTRSQCECKDEFKSCFGVFLLPHRMDKPGTCKWVLTTKTNTCYLLSLWMYSRWN